MNESFMNQRFLVAGRPPVPYSVRSVPQYRHRPRIRQSSTARSGSLPAPTPRTSSNFGVYQTGVGNNSGDELVPSTSYHLFKTQRRELFNAQRSIKLELYLFLHGRPGSSSGTFFIPSAPSYSSSLGPNPTVNQTLRRQRHTFGFCLWLRQWKGWSL